MAKMRGKTKQFGRCSVPGHGQDCELTQCIREKVVSRSSEKSEWKSEIAPDNKKRI